MQPPSFKLQAIPLFEAPYLRMSILGMIRLSGTSLRFYVCAGTRTWNQGCLCWRPYLPTATPKVSTLQTYLEHSETIKITFICQIQYHKLVVEATQRTYTDEFSYLIYFMQECLKPWQKSILPQICEYRKTKSITNIYKIQVPPFVQNLW